MENKLQQLTQKLYEEGLSKGRSEADDLVANAKKQAAAIIDEANSKAQAILRDAKQSADEMKKNTETEVALASRQVVATLKQQIEKLILAKNITPAVGQAVQDASFIKEIILAIVKNWDGNGQTKTDLKVMLPAGSAATLEAELKSAAAAALNTGFDVVTDEKVKTGFKVGPKDGSYYISFSDADFDALFKEYLRPKVAELLYGEK